MLTDKDDLLNSAKACFGVTEEVLRVLVSVRNEVLYSLHKHKKALHANVKGFFVFQRTLVFQSRAPARVA